MDCSVFLQRYSEAQDGRITDRRSLAALHQHRRSCRRCARLAGSLERGVDALRQRSDIEPSAEFRPALRRRLQGEVAVGDPITPTSAGLAAGLLLAAALGLFVYEGLTQPAQQTPAVAVSPGDSPVFADSLREVPAAEMDVTIPAFTKSSLEFHSSQTPLGTQVVFAP